MARLGEEFVDQRYAAAEGVEAAEQARREFREQWGAAGVEDRGELARG
jgi:hypothetical protein